MSAGPVRSRRACFECKLIKSKCEAPDDFSTACRRCLRLGLACEFSEKPGSVPDDRSCGVKRHAPQLSAADRSRKGSGAGRNNKRAPTLSSLPVPMDEIQAMHRDAQARGDSPGMANVVLLAGASGENVLVTPNPFPPTICNGEHGPSMRGRYQRGARGKVFGSALY